MRMDSYSFKYYCYIVIIILMFLSPLILYMYHPNSASAIIAFIDLLSTPVVKVNIIVMVITVSMIRP